MKNIFVSKIIIENVRHLKNIELSLPGDRVKNIIFTGKNGSGKTSVLDALSHYLNAAATSDRLIKAQRYLQKYTDELNKMKSGICVEFNEDPEELMSYIV